MFDNPDSAITGVGAGSGQSKDTKHWSERLKDANKSITRYFANYGTSTGLAGGSFLVASGVAMLVGAANGSTLEAVQASQSASTALILGGMLTMGATTIGEHVAKLHLNGVESLFEGADNTADSMVDQIKSGASKIEDPVLSDPAFQAAVVETFKDLQNDPKTRSEVVAMLTNSAEARRALMNAQKQIDATAGLKEKAANLTPHPIQDDLSSDHGGPVLH